MDDVVVGRAWGVFAFGAESGQLRLDLAAAVGVRPVGRMGRRGLSAAAGFDPPGRRASFVQFT